MTHSRLKAIGFRVITKVLALWPLCFLPTMAEGAESVVFPADSGYVRIKARYGARGDGKTNDTAAFQKTMADGVANLYLPPRTYLLSDSIVM